MRTVANGKIHLKDIMSNTSLDHFLYSKFLQNLTFCKFYILFQNSYFDFVLIFLFCFPASVSVQLQILFLVYFTVSHTSTHKIVQQEVQGCQLNPGEGSSLVYNIKKTHFCLPESFCRSIWAANLSFISLDVSPS